MATFNTEFELPPTHLVTDLDGTFIPLPDYPENQEALTYFHQQRKASPFGLVFCTGRHFESALSALHDFTLPTPDWIICDVGTSIYQGNESGFSPFQRYQHHLTDQTKHHSRSDVEPLLASVDNLTLQCEAHQGPFKISYECATEHTDRLVEQIEGLLQNRSLPYEVHGSIDPFLDCGLIDVLPQGVSKAYAVQWLATHADFSPDQVIYAGDSGNDLSALASGFRAILVANASPGLAVKIRKKLGDTETDRLLYYAGATATSGVLEGCRHFGLIT